MLPRSSLFVFPSDLVDEGVDEVLARVRERGVAAVTVAVAYHQARDVVPRGKAGRVVHRRDGVFLPLPPDVWKGVRLRPPGQPLVEQKAVARRRWGRWWPRRSRTGPSTTDTTTSVPSSRWARVSGC
ncbi:hypothetical protein ACQEVF_30260 [Nonomuraea polychroma]|uniref:hypothetical protein n=1 Tax=Nonomuraea polychroma TaxID=46176 RepID=UPI003D8A9F08